MTHPVGYYLPDGQWIEIPRLPIERAGLKLPCEVTRPDGRVVMVVEREETNHLIAQLGTHCQDS